MFFLKMFEANRENVMKIKGKYEQIKEETGFLIF